MNVGWTGWIVGNCPSPYCLISDILHAWVDTFSIAITYFLWSVYRTTFFWIPIVYCTWKLLIFHPYFEYIIHLGKTIDPGLALEGCHDTTYTLLLSTN